ncbi:MAG TPA: hypothetical protein VM900_13100 [Sphingomonas sp.]|nr:hypothetical protein [Sphingomonas sp.]
MASTAKETMMGEQDPGGKPENDETTPETVEEDGTGGEESSGAGYGNNAGYQGGAESGADKEDEDAA